MLRKGLALLLCLCLCAGLLPAALAEEPIVADVPLLTEENAAAEIPAAATASLAAEETKPEGEIEGFEPLENEGMIRTKRKLALVTLQQLFPKELTARIKGETHSVPVTWKCAENYDEQLEAYHFTPVLEGVKLAEGVEPPVLTVVAEKRERPPLREMPDSGKPAVRTTRNGTSKTKSRTSFPARYSAYELGLLPPVREQDPYGTCWAMAALGCMEADLILEGAADTSVDLSELQLAYYAYHNFYDEKGCNVGDTIVPIEDYLDKGGNVQLAYRTLANMVGCATEEDVPYSWAGTYQPGIYAGRGYRAPQLIGTYEVYPYEEGGRDSMKEAILQHGALYLSIRMDEDLYYSATYNSYYYAGENGGNHAVMVVGWDDNFPKEHFAPLQPSSDGAWLIRNSWGENELPSDVEFPDYGVDGYFWVSYEDTSVCSKPLFAYDAQNWQYDHCYGYDAAPTYAGRIFDCPNPTVLSQNFRVDGGERIDAVGIEAQNPGQSFTISLTCGDTTVTTEACAETVGFHLIPLTTPLTVKERSDVTLELTVSVEAGEELDVIYEPVGESEYMTTVFAACGSGGLVVNGENIGADGLLKLFTTDVGEQTPEAGIRIDAEHFPNPIFRSYITANLDTDGDGYLSEDERDAVTEIDLTKQPGEEETGAKRGVLSHTLRGVELFPALKTLNCSGLHLSELNLSANPALEELFCSGNELAALDLSSCPELKTFDCSENALAALDVTRNPKLETLACYINALTELNLHANPALKTLRCGTNQLTVLDLSSCTELEILRCGENAITELDLRANGALKELICFTNQLTALDVSVCPFLKELNFGENRLTEISLESNPALELFYCFQNPLTELDLSDNARLVGLNCDGNALTGLDVTHNSALEWLSCNSCGLTTLDLSQNPELTQLYCTDNPLPGLDVSKNSKLNLLYAQNVSLAAYDAAANPALECLYLDNNNLQTLDLSGNPELSLLSVANNPLAELDLSKNTKLRALSCKGCGLTALDLSNNPELFNLFAQGNGLTRLDLYGCAELYELYRDCRPDYSETTVCYSSNGYDEALGAPYALMLDRNVEIVTGVPIILTQTESLEAFIGQTVTLSVTAEGRALKYQWLRYYDDVDAWLPIEGATEPDYSFPVTLTDDGSHFAVAVTNVMDTADSDAILFTLLRIPGDVSADGTVNAKDVTALRQYLAGGYEDLADEKLVDVNRDGYCNAKDVTHLRRALAGGYGVELN